MNKIVALVLSVSLLLSCGPFLPHIQRNPNHPQLNNRRDIGYMFSPCNFRSSTHVEHSHLPLRRWAGTR